MNPQYFSQQNYGAFPQGFQNNGPNSQGFQSVPLAPPKGGLSSNPNPPSANSTAKGPQLNNLLGKMPIGNLGPFTVLPQGQKTSGQDPQVLLDQKQTDPNQMGDTNPMLDLDSNSIINGLPRNVQSQVPNGSSQNGASAGGYPIPSSQLPPSNVHSRPSGPGLLQQSPNVPQTSSSPHSRPNSNPPSSFTPSTIPSHGSHPPLPGQTVPFQSNYGPPGQFKPTTQLPSSNQPPLPGQSPMQMQPSSMMGQQPLPGQPPISAQTQMTGSPLMSGKPHMAPGQPLSSGQPPLLGQHQSPKESQMPMSSQQHFLGQPGQASLPTPSAYNHPPLPNQSQIPNKPPTLNQPTSGFPTMPPHSNASNYGKPQQPTMPGYPPQHGNAPGQSGQPPQPFGAPSMPNAPQLGRSSLPSQPPSFGQPPLPGQFPMPGQQPPNQHPGGFNAMPTGPHGYGGAPPSQYPNQLTNQMQNMSLSGSKQYTGLPQKAPDNSPHMPPPVNNQQMRSSGGFPPMAGHQQGMPPGPGGYPPQPGYPSQPGFPQQSGFQQGQQRRLDPDQMPSPIQVMTDDQTNRSGVFVTNQRGLVPPLVTTNFVVQDQGNASPRFIRSTMYNVPISHDIMKQTSVPFSLVISPMARLVEGEYPPPIVNFGELGPVRCTRCKAYMCPFMNFVDSGRRFQCAFCKATTDVPAEYFQHLDHTGQRMDRFERPELVLGTYEFVATADYCRNNILPKPPAFIFIIDVSYNSVKSGLVNLLCSQMKEIIRKLPVDQGMDKSNMRVGFITYNSSVHFYNIKGTLAAPQMLVVGDTHEMFMPLLDGFLSTPEESEAVIDALMEQIPLMFEETRETETILLPAILAGMEALKASECAGKLLVFNSNLPSAEAPGKLKNRDDRKLLGTDKERSILTPQNQAYNQLGQDCVQAGCSVDLFLFNNSYIDIATIGQVSRLSGGEVFKYTYFQADIDGERLIGDIIMDVSRPIAFDAIMRVRTSTGVRPTDFYGHFFMSNTTDMELASIDCDKAVAMEIKHDDKLQEEDGVFIQAALLYTSCSGQRRLRICNLSLKTCSQMADLYRSCDLDTLVNYISKQAIFKLMDNNPKAVKDAIVVKAAQILATYRKNCASPSSAGQLILPECMKLLPLYVNCLLKSDALSGGSDMTVDDRSFVMQAVMTMDVPTSVHFFYPRLMPIHDIDPSKEVELPDPLRCSIEKMSEQGVYILENGIHMFLWMGLGTSPDIVQKLFGVQSAIQVNIEHTRLPELDNQFSTAIRNLIEEIRIERHRHMRLTLVRQREKLEPVFKHFLVEDRGVDGSPSYVDFLCHMHKEIRNLLS